MSLVSVVCCQVEVCERGRSLVQRSLPSVSVIVKSQQWGCPSPVEDVKPGNNTPTYWWSVAYFTRLLLFQIIHCSIKWNNCILSNKKCLFGSIIPVILPNFPGRVGDNHRNFNQNIQFSDRNPSWDTLQCRSSAVFPDQVPRKIEEQKHKNFSVLEYSEKFQLLSKCITHICFLTV